MSEFICYARQIIAKRIIRRIVEEEDGIRIETDDGDIFVRDSQKEDAMVYLLRLVNEG